MSKKIPKVKPEKKAKLNATHRKRQDKNLTLINADAAGIDIGSAKHYVSVPEDRDEKPVRVFSTFTRDLKALSEWLKTCGIKTVAMESTGVYWIPLYDLLIDEGFDVNLVNARHLKNVSGRNKTDVMDCQWIQRLHTFGLLSGSFRPEKAICELRAYHRQREMLVSESSKHILHMQKAMTQMNLQLHNVLSDVTGATGIQIIRAIVGGEHDPKKLAIYRDSRCKNPLEIIEKSLEGAYREEHLFSLKQALELYDFYQEKRGDCDEKINHLLQSFEDRSQGAELPPLSAQKKKSKQKNGPAFNLRASLFQLTGVDLTVIPGLNSLSLFKIVSEVGIDMSPWKTEKHFASWLGLSPGNKISGEKRLPGRTVATKNRAAAAFRLGANTLYRSGSALGAYHRRMRYRLGAAKAVTATAHKLARIFYRLLKYGLEYVEQGQAKYEAETKAREFKNLKRRAKQMGYSLNLME